MFMLIWGPALIQHFHSTIASPDFTSRCGVRDTLVQMCGTAARMPPFHAVGEGPVVGAASSDTLGSTIVTKTKYNPWCELTHFISVEEISTLKNSLHSASLKQHV